MFFLKKYCSFSNKNLLVLGIIEIITISFLRVSHELASFRPRFQLIRIVSFNVGRTAPNLNNLKIRFLHFSYLIWYRHYGFKWNSVQKVSYNL